MRGSSSKIGDGKVVLCLRKMKNPTTKTTANANTRSKYKKVCIVLSLVPGCGGLVVEVIQPLVALEGKTKKKTI